MRHVEIVSVQRNLRVVIDRDRRFEPPEYLDEQVLAIWREEKAQRGDALFDGTIFSADVVAPNIILGHWIPYRYALAGYRDPSLMKAVGVLPLAVNGLTRCRGRVLMGLRSPNVAASPDTWELAPSGGVDPEAVDGDHLDVRRSLLQELEEETGFDATDVVSIEPFAAVKDWEGNALELCFRLDLSDDALNSFDPPIDEYRDFEWVGIDEWDAFAEGKQVLPMSRIIFKAALEADGRRTAK